MKRTSYRKGNDLVYDFWLVFRKDGDVRLTRTEPAITAGERKMSCEMQVPLALFSVPSMRATIRVPESDVPDRIEIDVEAAEAALRTAVGAEVRLEVIHDD